MLERRVALLAWIVWLLGIAWTVVVFWIQTLKPIADAFSE